MGPGQLWGKPRLSASPWVPAVSPKPSRSRVSAFCLLTQGRVHGRSGKLESPRAALAPSEAPWMVVLPRLWVVSAPAVLGDFSPISAVLTPAETVHLT